MVTHDPVAASYADRVVFLADGRFVGQLDGPTAGDGRRADDASRCLVGQQLAAAVPEVQSDDPAGAAHAAVPHQGGSSRRSSRCSLGAAIVMACGGLMETGIRSQRPTPKGWPVRRSWWPATRRYKLASGGRGTPLPEPVRIPAWWRRPSPRCQVLRRWCRWCRSRRPCCATAGRWRAVAGARLGVRQAGAVQADRRERRRGAAARWCWTPAPPSGRRRESAAGCRSLVRGE